VDQVNALTLYEHEPIPPIFTLLEEEQFCDDEYYYYIETRGRRTVNECYFSATDIAELLNIGDIYHIENW